jgi:hypothetical protein
MTIPRVTAWRVVVLALALFLIVGVGAPYLSADRFGKSVQAALESSLQRKVEIGKVRFDLFRGPGFRLEQVVIHEDPAFGIEPLAWVDELEARPSVLALLTGRLEFASLRLGDPVVNLTKTTRWNFERLLDFKVLAAAPHISVRNGRINFKFGDTKSVFYVTSADLDLEAPARSGGDWRLEFWGEPARTDRPAHGLGTFAGKGVWRRVEGQDSLDLDLELQRSPLGEITALVYGRDIGVHGSISSRIRLKGPARAVAVSGQLRLEELHRYDQAPMRGAAWPLPFRGVLDLNSQNLSLESLADSKQAMPISVRFKVAQYLAAEPRWGVNLTWKGFPAEPLAPLARHLGLALPERIKIEGALDGALGYSGRGSLQGVVSFDKTVVTVADAAPLTLSKAQVTFDGDVVRLAAARVQAGGSEVTEPDAVAVEAEYRWSSQDLSVGLSADSAGVKTLPLAALGAPAPLIGSLDSGSWQGKLRYQRSGAEPGEWAGQIQLRKAAVPVPGLADPVTIRSASAQIQGARVIVDKVDATAGSVDFSGSYRYEPGTARPHRFQISASVLDGEEWERLFHPTLRRGGGFLQRTLGLGRASLPAWLDTRHAEGTLRVETLRVAGAEFNKVHARILWDAARVQFLDAAAETGGGEAAAHGLLNLAGNSPAYKFSLRVERVEYLGGAMEGEAEIETAGMGAELVRGLKAEGRFSVDDLEVGALGPVRSLTGEFRASPQGGLVLSGLQLKTEADVFTGQGAAQKDGKLVLQLTSGERKLRVSGTLAQLRAE